MKDYWKEPESKKMNKKRIAITAIAAMVIIAIVVFIIIYVRDKDFREWVDTNILQKEVNQDKLVTIDIAQDENSKIYAFGQYIGILNKNEFHIYGSTAKEETIDGNISKIYTGQNGYTAVAITGTINKTVINVYDDKGKALFKTFLSTTRVSDIAISNDNKYLALAEVDTSGTIVQSTVKIISIEKSQEDSSNSIENTYKSESNKLITSIKYQDKNKLLCMYTDGIIRT